MIALLQSMISSTEFQDGQSDTETLDTEILTNWWHYSLSQENKRKGRGHSHCNVSGSIKVSTWKGHDYPLLLVVRSTAERVVRSKNALWNSNFYLLKLNLWYERPTLVNFLILVMLCITLLFIPLTVNLWSCRVSTSIDKCTFPDLVFASKSLNHSVSVHKALHILQCSFKTWWSCSKPRAVLRTHQFCFGCHTLPSSHTIWRQQEADHCCLDDIYHQKTLDPDYLHSTTWQR